MTIAKRKILTNVWLKDSYIRYTLFLAFEIVRLMRWVHLLS